MKITYLRSILFASIFFQLATGKTQSMTHESKDVRVNISQNSSVVYDYASNPENLPKWAAGLSRSKLQKDGDAWIADSPMGKVRVKFAAKNSEGILDHDVTLPSGEVNHNPLRVIQQGQGSEVVFTVIRRNGKTKEEFEKDIVAVQKDLNTLKKNLESRTAH